MYIVTNSLSTCFFVCVRLKIGHNKKHFDMLKKLITFPQQPTTITINNINKKIKVVVASGGQNFKNKNQSV